MKFKLFGFDFGSPRKIFKSVKKFTNFQSASAIASAPATGGLSLLAIPMNISQKRAQNRARDLAVKQQAEYDQYIRSVNQVYLSNPQANIYGSFY